MKRVLCCVVVTNITTEHENTLSFIRNNFSFFTGDCRVTNNIQLVAFYNYNHLCIKLFIIRTFLSQFIVYLTIL